MAKTITRSTDAERIQALVMHACGKNRAEIQDVVGMKTSTFGELLKKAEARGYIVGGKVTIEMVQDGKTYGPDAGAYTSKRVAKTPTKAKAKGKKAVIIKPESEDEEEVGMGGMEVNVKLEPIEDDDEDCYAI